jgi:hypothetical protein
MRISGAVAPFRRPEQKVVLSHPVLESQVGLIAAQLVAGYGSNALRLAKKRADRLFVKGDANKCSDWYLVIDALEKLDEIGQRA